MCTMTILSRRSRLALLGACLLASTLARAELACPDTLEVQQRANAPNGWNAAYGEQAPRLTGVTVFDGPPANRVSVKYNYRRQIARELNLIWNLTYNPRSYYLQCQYERTTALISAPLPAGTRGCQVVFDKNTSYSGGDMAVKRMVCR
jgi:hypothetical protein